MKKLYWESIEVNNQKFFFTVTEKGLNFVSSPGKYLSELFDFYPDRYDDQFMYDDSVTADYLSEFTDYFDQKRQDFDLPLDLENIGTDLQHQVWAEIQKIPYGQTVTYKQLAENIGKPKAIRPVAHAGAMNPDLIGLRCHRVVRSSGDIGEYRGGKETKKALLELEKKPIEKHALISKLPLPKLSQLGKSDL